MKARGMVSGASFFFVGICFIAICTLLIAPYVYRKNTADSIQQTTASIDADDSPKDRLKEFILEHEQMRSLQLSEIDDIINSETTDDVKEAAQKQKMDIIRRLEIESTISGILRARGYIDAAVAAGDEYVNIMVHAVQTQTDDVARILELVLTQTDVAAENIKIIPVN